MTVQITNPQTIPDMQRAADQYAATAQQQRDRQAQLMVDRDKLTAELERVAADLREVAEAAAFNEGRAADFRAIIAECVPPPADNGGQPPTRPDGRMVPAPDHPAEVAATIPDGGE